jgi:hypothetical protein
VAPRRRQRRSRDRPCAGVLPAGSCVRSAPGYRTPPRPQGAVRSFVDVAAGLAGDHPRSGSSYIGAYIPDDQKRIESMQGQIQMQGSRLRLQDGKRLEAVNQSFLSVIRTITHCAGSLRLHRV